MFKVIATSARASDAEQASFVFSSDVYVDIQAPCTRRGMPRTPAEWTALVKIASGEIDIAEACYERLCELGLVERRSGTPCLTQHGRLTLGLPE